MTILYSIMHLLVDGICAFAMYGRFLPRGNTAIDLILYNFCAFALQMPFGVMLDYLELKSAATSGFKTYSHFVAAAGVLFTILGAVTHPILLGIGNALFHIGGGVGTIHEDRTRNWKGRGLGVFVAPGALGLYLGTLAANNELKNNILWLPFILMILACVAVMIQHKYHMREINASAIYNTTHKRNVFPFSFVILSGQSFRPPVYQTPDNATKTDVVSGICISTGQNSENRASREKLYLSICCMSIVILRSYIGMTVAFPWKTTLFSGLLAVLAVVLGKMIGGFLAAKHGIWQTSAFSLLMASIAYIGSSAMPVGIAALFLFNMTMPITLYLLICRFPQMPGFSFGLLTFGLFLGFLPEYFGLRIMADGSIIGCVGSILSLFILLAGMYYSNTYIDTCEKSAAKGRLY